MGGCRQPIHRGLVSGHSLLSSLNGWLIIARFSSSAFLSNPLDDDSLT